MENLSGILAHPVVFVLLWTVLEWLIRKSQDFMFGEKKIGILWKIFNPAEL